MRWEPKPIPNDEAVKLLQSQIGISRNTSIILAQRGINNYHSAKSFFRPKFNNLHDPFLMKDMKSATDRIKQAINNKEKILIYGDYDVDGVASTALLTNFLRQRTNNIFPYIPDRGTEGYGVSVNGIKKGIKKQVSLIISIDCGIKALKEVEYAKKNNIDFIICDHHLPESEIPNAIAVLDPKRVDCKYPFKELCGCGIGFKLIQALSLEWGIDTQQLINYLDLVSLATVADQVPLYDENRIITYLGLEQINKNPRPGIKALLSDFKGDEISTSTLVFKLSPKVNAAGRMRHATLALELLMCEKLEHTVNLSEQINSINIERQEEDKKTTEEALIQIKHKEEESFSSTLVHNDNWHPGIIGIVASRLIEKYYRPTIVLTKKGQYYIGSARSINGFDIYKALKKCSNLLEQFGGHKYAAGLKLHESKLKLFRSEFEEFSNKNISIKQKIKTYIYDLEIPLTDLNLKFFNIIKQMGPFGPKNLKPIFCTRDCLISERTCCVGKESQHLQIFIKAEGKTFKGIAFNKGEELNKIKESETVDILYSIEKNSWNGNEELQLMIIDIIYQKKPPFVGG
ncbi:MAG: single-stranded-DNA-specific exonuclease RecJ [Flavobacteriales bacterium]|nr:MAG: single-stranded-DNA-specific exonuclease RecJ [Flavobacteriales bacterium]